MKKFQCLEFAARMAMEANEPYTTPLLVNFMLLLSKVMNRTTKKPAPRISVPQVARSSSDEESDSGV